jgi:hypothetical protein
MHLQSIALLAIFLGLAFVGGRKIRYAISIHRLSRLGRISDIFPTLLQLDEVNRECKEFTFVAKRAIDFPIKDKVVTLVDGKACYLIYGAKNPFWQQDRCLFIVSPKDKVDWFSSQKKLFREAFTGSRYTVFWADPVMIHHRRGQSFGL